MFKRIKNLLDISKYTVDEIRQKEPTVFKASGDSMFPNSHEYRPATIVDLKGTNPFDEYETTEQSSDDTTPRNG